MREKQAECIACIAGDGGTLGLGWELGGFMGVGEVRGLDGCGAGRGLGHEEREAGFVQGSGFSDTRVLFKSMKIPGIYRCPKTPSAECDQFAQVTVPPLACSLV